MYTLKDYSSMKNIPCGVPQDSILSPMFFNSYPNDFCIYVYLYVHL